MLGLKGGVDGRRGKSLVLVLMVLIVWCLVALCLAYVEDDHRVLLRGFVEAA
jgi:Tfp pilus assembly protein PilX